jgi:ornithine carbamoyltransferase
VATFLPYRVTSALMAYADPQAVFMHCLPAHRGEEVTAEVIDGPQSVVFPQAGNRLPTAQAILYTLATGKLSGATSSAGLAPVGARSR